MPPCAVDRMLVYSLAGGGVHVGNRVRVLFMCCWGPAAWSPWYGGWELGGACGLFQCSSQGK